MRGPAQDALLKEHARSLGNGESANVYAGFREANPGASAKELGKALRAFRVKAALAWHKKRSQGGKDSSLPFAGTAEPLAWHKSRGQNRKDSSLPPSGTAKLTEPLSLEAQPKSDGFPTVRYYLSLTEEEMTPVEKATRLANPNADDRAFNLAYKIALWKADSVK